MAGAAMNRNQASDYAALVAAAQSDPERVRLCAAWITEAFDRFYDEFLRLTWLAKAAFENRDPPASVAHAKRRLRLYNATVQEL
ncbi:MAG TPA: isocitrate dehydrogenase kinase/phosphatase AceK regulatory subunit, partial [Steroidobacteraceae bacterium]